MARKSKRKSAAASGDAVKVLLDILNQAKVGLQRPLSREAEAAIARYNGNRATLDNGIPRG
jgi:hypothetical protein